MTPCNPDPRQDEVPPPVQSSTTTGAQDCSTCVRRRIRCDRTLPQCVKCSKKGLACPGYGPRLRWANGIAVRGHLKGRTTPHIEKPARARASSKESTSPRSIKSPESDTITRQPSIIDPLEKLFPGFPDPATRSRLLDHYDKNIAGLMVWIDSERNEYRRLVLPLADRQPVLLLAILAISAQHLAVTKKVESSFSARARDAAVTMISTQIRQVTGRLAAGYDLGSEIDTETAVWMLASMLTLASYEMAESESGAVAADSHRQAARTLVNALATTNRENSLLFNFLRNQLSIYDILACTTSFDPMSTADVILPAPDHSNLIFSEYLALLHRVTILSRQRYDMESSGDPNYAELPITPSGARAGFELARGSTLMAAGLLELPRDERCRDFIRIVDLYHHSALLYTYRCLFPGKVDPTDVRASTTAVFERLTQLEDRASCIQNLPWPVFVAGTECCGNSERQSFIAQTYEDIARDMGFKHYLEVLKFLKDLWSGENADWTDLARRYGLNGKQILAV
ncbi:uncharacterized protein Z518_03788 [Rhinocladiella mackenziei CBS 650.93]|uniref:Rhinocladiella mackenziei CBS 650.93 unplaced genomic scaffold supercont1.3, whole genome shotgun sequence n=1 Tax=Rhinocladiella mackenziei CBS 650.93 TaxID=1442369 RepID=A0A0D2IRP8_9EURO|nr:uncharacterized protein Z518_03788 [Rhinocladiella mackenziei CBS 650.93]KIX05816.1 hypothetical protein Z518_03788 [Rhinocladiella mackenziei CBS 650.93]